MCLHFLSNTKELTAIFHYIRVNNVNEKESMELIIILPVINSQRSKSGGTASQGHHSRIRR